LQTSYDILPWHLINFKQILGGENGPLWKDYCEGGATWAFNVGSQSMTCPIIVEDLDRPRQMLVEVNDSVIICSLCR
jgi:hypothetical protein